ncbi:valine--tRNA ligase [Pelagibacteraceae bacterium]|nr:valine--tRNA ligase [Pelagibacteraceae bacterium]
MLEKYYKHELVEKQVYDGWEKDKDFKSTLDTNKDSYCIVIPPPNVTGTLHMGHALNNTLQDILIRYNRMQGKNVLWQPGMDHAGIATEMVVERELAKKKIKKTDLSREEFVNKVWEWKDVSGGQILNQLKRLGSSCDWERERFTFDEGLSAAVKHVFIKLYKDGLIYKDKRLSNWDPNLKTTISDLEVIQKEVKGNLWYIDYEIENSDKIITVATTRPETMLGDTGIAVHPDDERYKEFVGKNAILPIVNKKIKIVADSYAKSDQGSGAVKITPAHDFNDFEVGKRNSLEVINIFDENACLNENVPEKYRGLDRYVVRDMIVEDLIAINKLNKIEENDHTVPYGDRSNVVIEPWLTDQWFVDAKKLSIEAIKKVKNKETNFIPTNWEKTYFEWMENIQPWCISRQLLWGHQIPAWYGPDGKIFVANNLEEAKNTATLHYGKEVELEQDQDVLDTWFSSALWPFSTLGWPDKTPELEQYYPTSVLVTGFDIIFFWVARMMMMGLYFTEQVPFQDVYVHALVRDENGQKMSKSKGNVIDPIILMDQYGADALRMTLCSMAAQGRDIKLSAQRVEGYRNFITKIWNAIKFCEINECKNLGLDITQSKNTFNVWILNELDNCERSVSQAVKNYKFNEAANTLYKFTWNIFCDWYIEFSKSVFYSNNEEDKHETRNTASYVLTKLMIMLHPIMPFITEHLWQEIDFINDKSSNKIIHASWPKIDLPVKKNNKDADKLIQIISAIRSTRAELNVPVKSMIDIKYTENQLQLKEVFNTYEQTISSIARIDKVEIFDGSRQEGDIQIIVNDEIFYLSLLGIIDFKEESDRLTKNLSKISEEIDKISSKLESSNFIENAPKNIISEQKERLEEYMSSKSKIEDAIKSFSN